MSRLLTSWVRLAVVIAVVFIFCSVAVAAEQPAESRIAQASVGSTGLSWQPAVSYESAVLTVSGPGDLSLRREFAAGEALAFRVDDTNQATLEDGQYAWELRFSPVTDAGVKEALRVARESGDTGEIEDLKKQGKLPAEPLVISGYFRVQGGSIIVENDAEAARRRGGERVEPSGLTKTVDTDSGVSTKDQVILDDLIVDGSACIGQDCVNGESFGFDTIRLKENNLRIRAVDTSSTSSFPTRDWQITFNDSANGGANKFSIDDIDGGRTPFTLEAGAPSHSLYVDDGGRLGLGTNTPVADIHVKNGNTPTLRLEQDGSSGFTAQTWDVAGNEANFFIRDATNGSTLPFRIRPSAPTSSIDVAGDGDIGIGTDSPEGALHIRRSGHVIPYIQSSNNQAVQLRLRTDSTNRRIIAVDSSDNQETQIVLGDNGEIQFLGPTASDDNVVINSSGIEVNGTITLNGTQIHPDFVFSPSYQLETIPEHAEYMWTNRHLPAVGAQPVNTKGEPVLDVGSKTLGMLEELEKAHIYIEQLHKNLEALEQRLVELEGKLE